MIKRNAILAAVAALTAVSAQAAATQAKATKTTPSSTASAASVSGLSNVQARYVGLYYGPKVSDPVSDKMPGDAPIFARHRAEVDYKLTEKAKITSRFEFRTYADQDTFRLVDPFIGMAHSSLFSAGDFNTSGAIRYYIPVGEGSRAVDSYGSLFARVVPTYALKGTRFSFSAETGVQAFAYSDNTKAGAVDRWNFYTDPTVEYKISPTLSASVLYEINGARKVVASNGTMQANGDFLDIGLSWDATPKLNFSPYVEFDTDGGFDTKTSYLGFNLVYSIL